MGDLTANHPKCMTELKDGATILSRQLELLESENIKSIVMTTGAFDEQLMEYCQKLSLDLDIKFVKNEKYASTNYIYTIYNAKDYIKDDDILLLHGDLVFSDDVLKDIINKTTSAMTVSSTVPLPEKDFKAVIENGKIVKIGVEYFNQALAAQPLYKLLKNDWLVWFDKIEEYCERGDVNCYAENAFNDISEKCNLLPLDVKDRLCTEIDNIDDLERVRTLL